MNGSRRSIPARLVGRALLLLAPCGTALVAQTTAVGPTRSRNAPATWSKAEHDLAVMLCDNLKALAEELDDCTYRGRFSKTEAVPDSCNSSYTGSLETLNGGPAETLLNFAQHACAKWHNAPRTQQQQQDCRALGGGYWRLQDAVERATVANANAKERNEAISLGESATKYVANVNPVEVSEKAKYLQQLNVELEKPHVSPGVAFVAGTDSAELASWVLHHCPSELVWGLPTKAYTTALGACSTLEPELRRFDENTLRLLASIPTNVSK